MSIFKPLRHVGVIGDIHAEDKHLDAVLAFLRDREVEIVMAVGDIADGPGNVDRCCDLLRSNHVAVVRGNHDRWVISGEMRDLTNATSIDNLSSSSREFLSSLPTAREFETITGRLLLCHGLGNFDMGGVIPSDNEQDFTSNIALRLALQSPYRFIVNGHTHERMVRRIETLTIINAGTLLNYQQPCFLMVDFLSGIVRYFDIDDCGISPGALFQLFSD